MNRLSVHETVLYPIFFYFILCDVIEERFIHTTAVLVMPRVLWHHLIHPRSEQHLIFTNFPNILIPFYSGVCSKCTVGLISILWNIMESSVIWHTACSNVKVCKNKILFCLFPSSPFLTLPCIVFYSRVHLSKYWTPVWCFLHLYQLVFPKLVCNKSGYDISLLQFMHLSCLVVPSSISVSSHRFSNSDGTDQCVRQR